MKSRNSINNTPNQRHGGSDYKTYSTMIDEVKFPKDRFKKFISTTYNDWFYDRTD